MKLKFRTILSIITFVAIVLIVWFARRDIAHAVSLLDDVNLFILVLLLPAQLLSYYAAAEMIFTYLEAKGTKTTSTVWERTRISLELNFVNHALPSGGVSGISYMNWRLKHLGVPTSRATVAQAVRYVMGFTVFLILLLLALFFLALDGDVNRFMLLMSTALASAIVFGTLFAVFIISNRTRLANFSHAIARFINKTVRKLLRKRGPLIKEERLEHYLNGLHADYQQLVRRPKDLKKPFLWAIVFTLVEIGMFFITFASLGVFVNPASILVAYGVATLAGFFVITPGGAGAYEVLMVSVLSAAGVNPAMALAGVVLTRVIIIVGTIVSGYIFYQLSLLKYGKHSKHEPAKPTKEK